MFVPDKLALSIKIISIISLFSTLTIQFPLKNKKRNCVYLSTTSHFPSDKGKITEFENLIFSSKVVPILYVFAFANLSN